MSIDIKRLKKATGLPKFGNLFLEYLESIGKEDDFEEFLALMFTNFRYPDTVFYIAFEDKEPVGFIWAEPQLKAMWIKEIFSRSNGVGNQMFEKLVDYAAQEGFETVKGLVGVNRADAMKRHFGMETEAHLLTLEIEHV